MDKRIRSPNYPALSLPEAITKVAQVYGSIGKHPAPREVIAKGMGYTGLNGASATAISALHKYGLLEKVGNEEIRVSERAMEISHPNSPEERLKALQAAAREPVLFAELYEKFPGKAPNEDLLRNYLVRKGFASAALSSVISAFRETSEMVEHELVGYSLGGISTGAPAEMPSEQPRSAPSPVAPLEITASGERPIGRYDYEGGAYVRIAASGDIDTEEALAMVETLVTLKRAELKRKNARTNARATVPVVDDADDEDLL